MAQVLGWTSAANIRMAADHRIITARSFQRVENNSRFEAEASDIAENLKVATLINAPHGQVKQHLLFIIRPSHTWQQVRDIVENYFNNANLPSSSGRGMNNLGDDVNAVPPPPLQKYYWHFRLWN